MRRYIVLLLITGIVWAQTDFDDSSPCFTEGDQRPLSKIIRLNIADFTTTSSCVISELYKGIEVSISNLIKHQVHLGF